MALLLAGQGADASIIFEEEVTQIPGGGAGAQQAVALAVGPEDILYAVWEDDRYSSVQQGVALLLAWSEPDDRGRVWSDEVRLPAGDDRHDASSPAISVGPDGVVHVVWQELQVTEDVPGGPYWEVRYAFSTNNGLDWEGLRVSQPNNKNNTNPAVVGLPGASAYVAWELDDRPGSSIALALVEEGSRAWIREDMVDASSEWEVNVEVDLGIDGDGTVHIAWQAKDMDGMWNQIASQVLYMAVEMPDRDTALPEHVPLADVSTNVTNVGPSLAVTKRHGVWVAWVQGPSPVTVDRGVRVLADRVVEGVGGIDVLVADVVPATGAWPQVSTARGLDDGAVLAISGVGTPATPPLFAMSCSEQGCFDAPEVVVPGGTPVAKRASVVVDGMENVYVGWDNGLKVVCTQRRNTPPGPPVTVRPIASSNDEHVEFVWSFIDVDAGSSQSGFEIMYSQDQAFPVDGTLGGVVVGSSGRSTRYVAPDPVTEGRWYWKVRNRDNLGLWSDWSHTEDFLADRTPPVGSILIDDGNEFTSADVVVLTLNVTDNLMDLGGEMHYQVSLDPNFPNASNHPWPPPNPPHQEIPAEEGIKVIFFRIFDASGLFHTSMDTIVYNATPVQIVHVPITTAPVNKDLNVSCSIFGAQDVTATLYHRKEYEEEFRDVEMERDGTLFWTVIDKDHMSVRGVFYYIEVEVGSVKVTHPEENAAEEPHEIEVYETTDVYQPPIYNPVITFTGALIVLIALVLIWWYRLREGPST
jgi:hypothetical protein